MKTIVAILLLSVLTLRSTWSLSARSLDSEFNPLSGGKYGNPGSKIEVTKKALDFAANDMSLFLTSLIRPLSMPDWSVPIGLSQLQVRPIKIIELSLPKFNYHVTKPARLTLWSQNGRIRLSGGWRLKSLAGSETFGEIRATVNNFSMNISKDFGRAYDNKPIVNKVLCDVNLGDMRLELIGLGLATSSLKDTFVEKIKKFYENSICDIVKSYVQDIINAKLATFPTKIALGGDNRFTMDYGLMINQRTYVTNDSLYADLKGEVLNRAVSMSPFYPQELTFVNNNERMIRFTLGDYAFNTLFKIAHTPVGSYRSPCMSCKANDINSIVSQMLLFNCTASQPKCLGSIFPNMSTNSPYGTKGEIVYRTYRKSATVYITDGVSLFNADGGILEVYSNDGKGKRELLARVEAPKLRGLFSAKMSKTNITANVSLNEIELVSTIPVYRAKYRTISDEIIEKLSEIVLPVLNDMYNTFLSTYASFPVPLVDGVECISPVLRSLNRNVQVDCDVRINSV